MDGLVNEIIDEAKEHIDKLIETKLKKVIHDRITNYVEEFSTSTFPPSTKSMGSRSNCSCATSPNGSNRRGVKDSRKTVQGVHTKPRTKGFADGTSTKSG